jgi:AcrR family transcriptional regulator
VASKPSAKRSSTRTSNSTHGSKAASSTAAAHNSDHGLRRLPRQERARWTVDAILQAAAEVIDERGWANASTNRIAERAGVSIGSLYQYFDNKEAILSSLFERHHRQIHEVVERNLVALADPELPLAAGLKALFRDLVVLHRADPVVARVLSTATPHPTDHTDHEAHPGHDHRALVRLLAARPDVAVSDLATAARIVEITVGALTRWMVHEAPDSTDLNRFIDESVRMVAGYLSAPSPDRTADAPGQ